MTAPWTDAETKLLLMLANSKCTVSDIRDGLMVACKSDRTGNDIIAKLAELRAEQAA